VSKDIVYEVRCERCRTSFAPETRRCVHCGAPLAKARRVVSTAEGFDPVHATEDGPAEDGELLARGPRTAIWVVIALVTAVASMLRTCVE
jgi:ribosomal protein L37E